MRDPRAAYPGTVVLAPALDERAQPRALRWPEAIRRLQHTLVSALSGTSEVLELWPLPPQCRGFLPPWHSSAYL